MSDMTGQTIGNYHVEAMIGSGGMGKVYRARHIHLDRPCAIKVMHESLASDPKFQARFRQEAKAIAALQHPNIVEVYDFGEENGRLYLVLELLTDGSLRTLLQLREYQGQALPLTFGLTLMRHAADALAYAHRQGMIHRDIKPDNMLLKHSPDTSDPYQQILKLSDFGLARLAESSVTTVSGTVMGTPAYMSPEQCQGQHLDGRADIYALGVVLYEVATGCLPFAVKTLSEAAYKHVHTPPPPPRQVCPDLPAEVEAVILRCLAKRPDERYATAEALSSALLQLVQHPKPVPAAPTVRAAPPTADAPQPPRTSAAQPSPPHGSTIVAPTPARAAPPNIPSLTGPSALPRVQVLDNKQQVLCAVGVTSSGLTIGRLSDNAIVLDDERVSRHHARIDWDGQQVTVTDTGSQNGTRLAGIQLAAQVAHPWGWREMVRIGPFWLRLEPPKPATGNGHQQVPNGAQPSGTGSPLSQQLMSGAQPAAGTPPTKIAPTAVQSISNSGRIGIVVDQASLTLTPGQPAVMQLTLANLGTTVDHFKVTVEGVPESWLQRKPEEVQLNPGMQLPVVLNIVVPRAPESRAGEYSVTLRVISRENPRDSAIAQVRWVVLPFVESQLTVTPRRAIGRAQAHYSLMLRNGGNRTVTYRLSAEDDEQALHYIFQPEKAELGPGEAAEGRLQVDGARRLIGNATTRQVRVQAAPDTLAPELVTAEFVHQALIPIWAPPMVLVLLIALVVGLFKLFAQPPTLDNFRYSPEYPQQGQSVEVRWQATRAYSMTLTPDGKSAIGVDPKLGRYTFEQGFADTTKVTAVVTNQFGRYEQSLTINVLQNPTPIPGKVIVMFSVDPPEVELGKPVTITWEVSNPADLESLTIDQFGTIDESEEVKGQRVDYPETDTEYRLVAVSKNGVSTEKVAPVKVINSHKEATDIIDNAIHEVQQSPQSWSLVLERVANQLPLGVSQTVRSDALELATRSKANDGSVSPCGIDFVSNRTIQSLQWLKTELGSGDLSSLPPAICHSTPISIDLALSPSQWSPVIIYGYDLDLKDQADQQLQVSLVDNQGKTTPLDESRIDRKPYQILLDLKDMAPRLQSQLIKKIVVSENGQGIARIDIKTWDPQTHEVDVAILFSDAPSGTPRGSTGPRKPRLLRGDGDFMTSADSPTYLKLDGKIFNVAKSQTEVRYTVWMDMYAKEKKPDNTTASGEWSWQFTYDAPQNWQIVDVNKGNDSSVTEQSITTHDPIIKDQPVNEVVERFEALVDHAGSDVDKDNINTYSQMIAYWRPLKVTIERIRPPWLSP